MKMYRVCFGDSPHGGRVDDSWIVRGRNFIEAATKANKIAARLAKDYTNDKDVISLDYLGKEREFGKTKEGRDD